MRYGPATQATSFRVTAHITTSTQVEHKGEIVQHGIQG